MDLYAENILDHYKHPHHKEELSVFDIERAEMNLSCGDRVTVRFALKNGVIHDVGWTGDGCAISQAAMSMLSDEMMGKTLTEVGAWTKQDVLNLLGVPVGERRLKCALLSLLAIRNAVRSIHGQEPLHWADVATV